MNTFVTKFFLLLLPIGLVGWVSISSQVFSRDQVKKAVPSLAPAGRVSFSQDIVPLLTTKCNIPECHDGSQPPSLGNYKKVRVWLGRIQFRINYEKDPMPPKDSQTQLTEKELELLNAWIKQGAKNN